MPQHILLAHLQSMQQQLDFLVHKHLSPLEIRQHHVQQALERLNIHQPSSEHPDLDDEHTAIYENAYQIQTLTESILQSPEDPTLWMHRGLIWKRMGNTGIAVSDFVRACQQWVYHPERLNNTTESHDLSETFSDIASLSPQMAQQLTNRFPLLEQLLITKP